MMNTVNAPAENDTLTLKLIGYRFEGTACIIDWYDQTGFIKMKSFEIFLEDVEDPNNLLDIVRDNLNDNGFGCQHIKGAILSKWGIYSTGRKNDPNISCYDFITDNIYVNIDDKNPMTNIELDTLWETDMY